MGLKVGITGGIGSGKSFVASIFKTMGIPFYDADWEAKNLMNHDPLLRQQLISAFGDTVYDSNGKLNRAWLAKEVFSDAQRLDLLNSIVHPIVIRYGQEWTERQSAIYSLKEAALLIESGSYKQLDYLILVSAPQEVRIERVMQRDHVTREEVLRRIDKQMPEEEKKTYADFIIQNDGINPLLPQILKIHQQIIENNGRNN